VPHHACDDDAVTVLIVGKRNDQDVYKQLKRMG
jgi:hypothetical protein